MGANNVAAMREALEFAEDELWALGAFDSSKRVAAALAGPPEPPSNVAALREALEMFVSHASCLNHCDIHRFHPDATECDGVLADKSECPMKPECDAVFAGRAALAAPARNCDRYGDEDDAFAAWHESLNDGDVVSVRNAFRWLFALAEGKDESNG